MNSADWECRCRAIPGKPKRTGGIVSYKTPEELTDAYVNLLTGMRPLVGQGLSAAVYTQTSDVEVEVNGLMTYDREVEKIDVARAAEAARKLYLPPPIVKTLVPTSQTEPQQWRYTFEPPADDWFQEAFDDATGNPGRVVLEGQARPGRSSAPSGRAPTSGSAAPSNWTLFRRLDKSAFPFITTRTRTSTSTACWSSRSRDTRPVTPRFR